MSEIDPFLTFDAEAWAKLRAATPMTLDENDVERLRGVNERLSIDEIERTYLPLSRLLSLYVGAVQDLARTTDIFLGTPPNEVPYLIWPRRQCGGRQEHQCTCAANAAVTMAQ